MHTANDNTSDFGYDSIDLDLSCFDEIRDIVPICDYFECDWSNDSTTGMIEVTCSRTVYYKLLHKLFLSSSRYKSFQKRCI